MKENKTDWKIIVLYCIAGCLALAGIIVLYCFLTGLKTDYSIIGDNQILLDESAKAGDFIGGLVGSLWAFCGVILFFIALILQRKEFVLQRQELKNQRNEFTITRVSNVIYRQLEILNKNANELKFRLSKRKLNVSGIKSIHEFSMWLATCFPGDKLTENLSDEENNELFEFSIFKNSPELSNYIDSIENTISLVSNLIESAERNQDGINNSEANDLKLILASNINCIDLIAFYGAKNKIDKSRLTKMKNSNSKLPEIIINSTERDISKSGHMIAKLNELRIIASA